MIELRVRGFTLGKVKVKMESMQNSFRAAMNVSQSKVIAATEGFILV